MVTDQKILQVKRQADRIIRKVSRLERTKRLHQLEQQLKMFKKMKFVIESDGVRIMSYNIDAMITFDTYDELCSDMYAIKTTLTNYYLFPWKNSL